jgi:NAD(P)-dependent dehydrogenase (short-subunit alcohol dehydrogenase family)
MTERMPFPGLSLRDQISIVTGGGSGIGLETALVFAELGADVVILDRTPDAADAAAEQVRQLGRRAISIHGDVASEEVVVQAFERVARELGPVNIAVACAGILGNGGPIWETPVLDFDAVMGVNVRGSFLVAREAAKQMRPQKQGSIILLSSLDGLQAEYGMVSYCTSKGAILNLVRAASLDLARDQVRVNSVCPSVTYTPLLEGRLAALPNGPEILESYASRHPLSRLLTTRDIASAIAYLSSPLATGITGIALPVDAGIGATWDDFADPPWFERKQ